MARGYRDFRVVRMPDGTSTLLDEGENKKPGGRVVGTLKFGITEDIGVSELQDLLAVAVNMFCRED